MHRFLYIDEDSVEERLIVALRRGGLDVASTLELGREGSSDEDQLAFAYSEGRPILTRNYRDFAPPSTTAGRSLAANTPAS